jgi:hypothetical protein
MSTKVLQWELESLGLTAKQHLDHDRRVERHGHVSSRRHGGGEADAMGGEEGKWATASTPGAANGVEKRCKQK